MVLSLSAAGRDGNVNPRPSSTRIRVADASVTLMVVLLVRAFSNFVAGLPAKLLSGDHIPQLDRWVPTPRSQPFAIWAEGHGVNPVSGHVKRGLFLTFDVP